MTTRTIALEPTTAAVADILASPAPVIGPTAPLLDGLVVQPVVDYRGDLVGDVAQNALVDWVAQEPGTG